MNLRLAIPFYLGLGAPAERRRYADCQVRAARSYHPDLVRTLLAVYRGCGAANAVILSGSERSRLSSGSSPSGQCAVAWAEAEGAQMRRLNHRCAEIVLPDARRFFFKEFPWHHRFHDLERWLRLSRVDRAWRAAHLLPRFGINTPRAVGTAVARDDRGKTVEYLASEWLDGARPFPAVVHEAKTKEERLTLLCEFARHLHQWHEQGVYLRDLVKNVLVTEAEGKRTYWLTDLDGLHPVKGVGRARVIRHMRQLAHHVGPLSAAQANALCATYADRRDDEMAKVLTAAGGGASGGRA